MNEANGLPEPRRVASSIFRVTYVTLDEPVAVTVLGRIIGWWTPVPRPGQESEARGEISVPGDAPDRPEAPELGVSSAPPSPSAASAVQAGAPGAGKSVTGMTQADKDKVLGRVSKGRRD